MPDNQPFPWSTLASGLIGGFSTIGSLIQQNQQNKFTQQTNEQNRQFALDMYNMQRRDAIADWNKANEYNSPQAQMQRFKDAGLSPHLIYGQMTNAPVVKTGDAPKFEAQTKQAIDTSGALAKGFNSMMAMAEMNLAKERILGQKAQNDLIREQAETLKTDRTIKLADAERRSDLHPYILGGTINRTNLLSDQQKAQAFKNYRETIDAPLRTNNLLNATAKLVQAIATDKTQAQKLNVEIDALKQKMHYYGLTEQMKLDLGKYIKDGLIKSNENKFWKNQESKATIGFKRWGLGSAPTKDLLNTAGKIINMKQAATGKVKAAEAYKAPRMYK